MFLRIAPLVFLTLAAAPLRAQSPCEESVHEGVRAVLDELQSREDGFRVGTEDFDVLRSKFLDVFDACGTQTPETLSMRARVMARIAELERKAAAGMLRLIELDEIEDQAIDAALDHAVARLYYQVQIGVLDTDVFLKMEAALNARAKYAIDHDPEIDAIAGRLQAEIERLIRRANAALHPTAGDVDVLQVLVTERRVALTLRRFEERSFHGWATDADLEDVLALVDRFYVDGRGRVRAMVDAWLEYVRDRLRGEEHARALYAAILKELNACAQAALERG